MIGIIEAINTGIIKLLFIFLAKITTKILPKKKLNPKATPISPNVFALFSGLEMSARIVVAVAAVPPLKPSISLAINKRNNGIAAIELDQSNRTVKDNIDIPMIDPAMQKRVTGFLPYLSLKRPINGEAENWANWYVHDNNPYVLALESKSKTKEGKIGNSILSLNRSFNRVVNALSRINFLFGFNKLFFTIFNFISYNFYYHTC